VSDSIGKNVTSMPTNRDEIKVALEFCSSQLRLVHRGSMPEQIQIIVRRCLEAIEKVTPKDNLDGEQQDQEKDSV
jgi:hypothetical protein